MSEKVSIEDGRLKVDRPGGDNRATQPIDVALDDIVSVSFTRSANDDNDGALLVKVRNGADQYVRVSNAEGPDLLQDVLAKAHSAKQDTAFAPDTSYSAEESIEDEDYDYDLDRFETDGGK